MNNSSTPSVPADVGPGLRQFLLWVRNRLGTSGMNRAVTFSDLVSMGVVTKSEAEKQAAK